LKKLTKMRQMTADELKHRLRERVRREADRLRFHLNVSHDREFAALIERHGSLKSYLVHGPAKRFYASAQDREGMCAFIEQHFPEWLDGTIEQAGRLCEHRVDVFGHTNIALGGDIDWHRDPVSGYHWPKQYWADYDLVQSPRADAKLIHELNRHQHLPRLAKAYYLTGDEPYAREALSQIESWIDQNPRWNGINWQSSLEIAIRSISWMWTLFLLLESDSLDEDGARRICGSLFAQLDHVYRYPSTYSSPNTHLIGEAAALFVGGLLFPELPRAEAWRQFGAITLLNEMQRQVSEDGVYCELSSYYHCYATDFYLQVFALARWNRVPLPEWMWTRLAHMLEFVMHLTRGDGTIPPFGDDDGGRVLAMSRPDYRSFRDGLCSGAVLFGRGDLKHQSGGFCEESLWLLGDDAWPIYNSVASQPPSELRRNYPQSGYFIQRSGWEKNDSHVVFDCGGLGAPTGGHGHADALSLTLFSSGHEFLIDPGTSVYNCEPEWRTFFRSTRAHNTVVVDGASQSEIGGTFSWKRKAESHLAKNISLPGMDYIDAEHDGYANQAKAITHRRRLIYVRPNYWIVLDDLRGRGEHDYEFLYHFAPEAELTVFGDESQGEIDCRARIQDAGLQMLLYGSTAIEAEAVCGQTQPIQGWASRRYGDRAPSPVLRASTRAFPPTGMMSFLIPGTHPVHSRRFQGGTGKVIAVALRNGDYDDLAVMSMEDADMQLIDCSMRGEFFWMRMENGTLRQLLAVNARSFSYGGEQVFESAEVIPYVQAYFWENGMVIERGENEGKVYVRDLRDRQFQRN
jgi:hypothetical protein